MLQATNTPTLPPTATWAPLFPSSTPEPTRSYACPSALPLGWGTETPQAWWNMECGNCLLTLTPPAPTGTSVFASTPDPSNPTATSVTPTGTPFPSATATPTLAATPEIRVFDNGLGNLVNIPQPWPQYPAQGSFYQGSVFDFTKWDDNHDGFPVGVIFLNQTGGSGGRLISIGETAGGVGDIGDGMRARFAGYSSLPEFFRNEYSQNEYEDAVEAEVIAWGLAGPGSLDYNYTFDPTWGAPYNVQISWTRVGGLGRGSGEVFGIVWWGDAELVEPTPGPEADYCGAVNDGLVSLPGTTDLGIELPSILVGPSTCTTWGGFGIEWPISLSLPYITLCASPISFGAINILGTIVSMDSIVFIMGAVLILRWVLRS